MLFSKKWLQNNPQFLLQFLIYIAPVDVKKTPIDKPFLFPCGNMKRDTLPANLSENNIPLEAIECYETIQDPNIDSAVSNKVIAY